MTTSALKLMFPVTIKPIIDGLEIVYYSNTETFEYDNTVYHLKLGKKTYNPICGYLVINKVDLEIMNYKRAQDNLELFSHVTSAVKYILNNRKEMHKLIFIASGILDSSMPDETKLLKKIGYQAIMPYAPSTLEEAQHFLDTFSMYQTQEQRSNCFGLHGNIYFTMLSIAQREHPENAFIFANQNLAVVPKITETTYIVNHKGEIESCFKFEPIEILGQKFTSFKKSYGLLKKVTLIDNKLYDLTTEKAPKLVSCPCCNQPLLDNKCVNKTCKEKVVYKACKITSKEFLNIKGLSYPVLSLFYDYLLANGYLKAQEVNELFFFKMPIEVIEELGFKKKQSKLLKDALTKAKKSQKLSSIIYSLDMPGMNKKDAAVMSSIASNNIDKFITAIEKSSQQNHPHVNLFKKDLAKLNEFKACIESIN